MCVPVRKAYLVICRLIIYIILLLLSCNRLQKSAERSIFKSIDNPERG